MEKKRYSIGFKYAVRGITSFFLKERNARIHLLSAAVVVVAGYLYQLNVAEWLWIALAIALVFITEMLNSAIELLCNSVKPGYDETIGRLKDIAAGAVLVAVIFALVVAGIIFVPYVTG